MVLLCASELIDPPVLGESASLFIDEGGSLTNERERVYAC